MNRQPDLLPDADADEVVECHGGELQAVLERAKGRGRRAVMLKVIGISGWKVTLRKMSGVYVPVPVVTAQMQK